ncbi:MAG: hypothetical protein KDD62_08095, partial [Bdellovibrionales bacterium]|nr:hypothetical protein [Bdellovibrionales bacterium]
MATKKTKTKAKRKISGKAKSRTSSKAKRSSTKAKVKSKAKKVVKKKAVAKKRVVSKTKQKASTKTNSKAKQAADKKTKVKVRSKAKQAVAKKTLKKGKANSKTTSKDSSRSKAAQPASQQKGQPGKRIEDSRLEDLIKEVALAKREAQKGEQSQAGSTQKRFESEVTSLIESGREKGFLTLDDIGEALTGDWSSEENVEELLTLFNENEIDIVEKGGGMGDSDLPFGAKADEDVESTPIGKSTDPVRMYLREMGNVSLLTREGEVIIAKRIEAGQVSAHDQVVRQPLSLEYVIDLFEKVKNQEVRMRDLFVDESEEGPSVNANGEEVSSGSKSAPAEDDDDDDDEETEEGEGGQPVQDKASEEEEELKKKFLKKLPTYKKAH